MNNNENYAKENTADELTAVEKRFSAKSLLEEIEPLIKEYFIGGFELNGEAINLNFNNGQKFCLTVKELN